MRDPRDIRRSVAAAQGAEAVEIARAGSYTAPSGRTVDLRESIAAARAGTYDVPPDQPVAPPAPGTLATRFEVRNESTLAAAHRLAAVNPVALNFASAHNPGGGFLGGARAQEESLCRASALHACLLGRPMYPHHNAARDPMYTAWSIYSPGVPVFRDDDGALLEAPWRCGFVSAAAPNVKTVRERCPERLAEVPAVMTDRIGRVLGIAAREGHASVVLGAWGCGAFGGDSELVAGRFHAALHGPFRGVFATVVFAVLDTTAERRFIGPFERMFG